MKNEEKRQRGRPEVSDKDRRKVLMQFRVTESEAKQIRDSAEQTGLSVSDWLRSLARQQ